MTVSYSGSVSKGTFGDFMKLLFRWRGSIFKSIWKETIVFSLLFVILQALLRHSVAESDKSFVWMIIKFVDILGQDVPYSFVLGFYVSFVSSRWMIQVANVPWPDRLCHLVAAYVHGSDERSRMIRRTLVRYALQLQVLTYQAVSTSVKRRFPQIRHLVEAGIMTPEEMAVYEKMDFSYGKWWLPCHWFTSLAIRAKKEGRIKECVLLKALLEELLNYRTMCACTIQYDWISVPLAYTQVATITAYFKALTLLVGKQSLEIPDPDGNFTVDCYFPFITIIRFVWTIGWLKVAQQILNPYGEDDDDFELNWTLDRAAQLAHDVVDRYHSMHPKITKDPFWDVQEIKLPQTAHSAKYMKNPELGSGFKLDIENAEYLPMDELWETDKEENMYNSQSVKRKNASRQSSSFIRRVLSTRFSRGSRKKSPKSAANRSSSSQQGVSNPAFSTNDETENGTSAKTTLPEVKKCSLRRLVKKKSPATKQESVVQKDSIQKNQASHNVEESDMSVDVKNFRENSEAEDLSQSFKWWATNAETKFTRDESLDDSEANSEEHDLDAPMPCIPEETSRANSLASIELKNAALGDKRPSQQMSRAFEVVKEASEVLQEITQSASTQDLWEKKESKSYESCCSIDSSADMSDRNSAECKANGKQDKEDVVVVIDPKDSPAS